MRTRAITALAVAALTVPAVAVTSPASADGQQTRKSETVSIRTKYGAVYFYNYGDQLHVGDYYADGRGVRGYAIANGKKHTVYTNKGLNSVDDKFLHLKEGTPVYVQLCYTKKGKNVKCSGLAKGYA